jgi:diguanylate cyclase (GGDEF)-like protein
MGNRTSNGGAQALPATLGRERSFRVDHVVAGRPDVAEAHRVLATMQLRFGAALRQLDRLRRRDALLEQENALLTEAVVKARRFAYHDELTGLPNRHLLLDRFNLAVALAERHDEHVALLFLDLDRFKHVNDTLGHSVGDKLLQQVAQRLVACIRASDTACRYGGDEFVVLLSELDAKDGAVVVADNIRAHLAAPHLIDGARITLGTSLGIAMYPVDAPALGDLLRVADLAMYRVKAGRPGSPGISDSSLDVGLKSAGAVSLLGPVESACR